MRDIEKTKLKLPSVIFGDNAQTWRKILMHYIKIIDERPVKILDITAGEKRMWRDIDINSRDLNGNRIMEVTFMDIKPKGDVIQGDYRKLYDDKRFKDESQHIIVFDPPYTPPLGFAYRRRKDIDFGYDITKRYELELGVISERDIGLVAIGVQRILKKLGYWVIKVQDTAYDWHYVFYDKIKKVTNLKYLGVVIQVLPSTWRMHIRDQSYFKPQTLHTYWMIYRKGVKK